MSDTLLYALNAVLPLLLLIGLGYGLRRLHFLTDSFLEVANKFVFHIALPMLMYYTLYSASGLKDIDWSVVLYSASAVLVIFGLGLITVGVFIKDPRQKGVILQGTFRSNLTIIGVPLAEALGGSEAVLGVALVSMIIVPLYNILSVISLSVFQKDENNQSIHWQKVIIRILTNPLIIAIALGILTLFIRSLIPLDPETLEPVFSINKNLEFLYLFIKWLGQIASPLALIVLGGGFQFGAIRLLRKELFIGVFWRIILAPTIGLLGAIMLDKATDFFSFSPAYYPALIATFASPAAVSSAIMAKEMGGDEQLAGQIVVWTSLLAIITLFIIVVVLRTLGAL
ncbi:MAG: AEC family transporter [Candidatus Izemoplasmatales bacterium]|nr:AEC family transporter [Candidatus Izemoplasmatales bacterium]MDD4355592.1 AEC family transporter [Candidatus Izemoplasmatales bacterium]MDD4987622.1 AEC family transporter [Candidatus Izemoplasmatales bacterium]NLF48070.1 hypothetical protein [Acholeplasmataceae bacterium]